MKTSTVAIAVSCYNRLDNVRRILHKLRQLHLTRIHNVIFASDGCTDGTQDFLKAQKDITSIISGNAGVAINKNRILKVCKKFKYIFILEDDIVPVSADFIKQAIEITKSTDLQHLNYGVMALFKPDEYQKVKLYSSGTLNGQVIFLTDKVLTEVGYFNSKVFGKYGHEHVEYTHRVCRKLMYKWGPFYTFWEPHKLFNKLSENGGMDIRVKIDWVHRRNKGKFGDYLRNAKKRPVFIPEPKLIFELFGAPL